MLFKDSNKVKAFTGMTGTVDYAAVKNYIESIEKKHLIPIVGKPLYNQINDAYTASNDEESLTQQQKDLLHNCRLVIAPYLQYYYALKNDGALGTDGFKRHETDNTKTAYQYQVNNFLDAALNDTEAQTEILISFLEENSSTYTLWKTSDEWKAYRNLFIKSGKEFNEYFTTASPNRNYMAMKSKMYDVENLHIEKFLGTDLFTLLKEKDKNETPAFTDKEKELMPMLKKAIAAFTIAFSLPFINVRIDANGLTVSSDAARSSSDKLSSRSAAKPEAISFYKAMAESTGREWLEKVNKFLITNKTDFPDYPPNQVTTTTTDTTPYQSLFGLT